MNTAVMPPPLFHLGIADPTFLYVYACFSQLLYMPSLIGFIVFSIDVINILSQFCVNKEDK